MEHWARLRASEPALYDGDARLSYGDWNEYADMLADALTERGLGVNDVIAVICANRIEWAVIAIAAAKIDAGLATFDPDLDSAVLRRQMIMSGAGAIIVGDCDPLRIAPALLGLPLRLRATLDVAAPGFFDFYDLFPPAAPRRFSRARPPISSIQDDARRAMPIVLPHRLVAPAPQSREATPSGGFSLLTVPLHSACGPIQFWSALHEGHSIAFLRRFERHPLADAEARGDERASSRS